MIAKELRLGLRSLVVVPRTPNFLNQDGQMVPISEFDNETLRKIAEQWTENLIAEAELRRKRRPNA